MNNIVKIYWKDAHSDSRWMNDKELDKWINEMKLCVTVGQIIRENKQAVCIAASFDGDESWGELVWIPRPLIVKIEKL